MGLFSSGKSHLETIEAECQAIAQHAAGILSRCDQSLRGKFQNMSPEDRADLLKEAGALSKKLHAAFAVVEERQRAMEQSQGTSEDLLAGQTRLVAAKLDVERASKSMAEARQSLMSSMAEIEQFYGARSPEAKQVRRVLDDLAAS
jgi:hypothetical protein